MTGADVKDRLKDWHSTLAGSLIAVITVVVVLLYCHVITAAQIVSCADSATKILAMVAAGVSAIALMLTKSGNQDAAQVGKDMLGVAGEIKKVAKIGLDLNEMPTLEHQLGRPAHFDDDQIPDLVVSDTTGA